MLDEVAVKHADFVSALQEIHDLTAYEWIEDAPADFIRSYKVSAKVFARSHGLDTFVLSRDKIHTFALVEKEGELS
jgi:hypothetical protein